MKIFTLLHKSTDKGTINLGQWSRMGTVNVRTTSDSILSRICLASLILLMLGGFTTRAWGTTVSSANSGDDVKNNKIVMTNNDHVTFTFAMDDYDISNAGWPTYQYYLGKFSGKKYGAFTWSVDAGYAVKVTNIAFNLRGYSSASWDSDDLEATFNGTNKEIGTNGTGMKGFDEAKAAGFANGVQIEFENQLEAKYPKEFYIKDITITYTVATTYSVRFNGNGSTGGSMSNQAFVYGTAQNLSANAFTRSYSVTYDEAGGSTVSDAVANYTFAGWATSADGDVVYTGGQNVNNLTTTPNGVYDIYAKWTSASVILPSATKDGAVLDGWYNGDVNVPANKVGDAGDPYTPTANVTLKAKWINKYTFEITGDNYTINNEAWNKTPAFTFVHADEANMTTTIQNTDVISYNRGTNTISALKIGTSKITFTQNTSSSVKNGTIEFTITVDSVANTLAVSGTEFTRYVKQDITSVRSGQNSDGTISATSSNYNLAHYNIATNTIEIPNSDSQTLPFDDVTITISQAPTAKYKAKKHTITLTVQKYPNALKCAWNNGSAGDDWDENMNFDSKLPVKFSSTNTSGPAISVTQSPASAVATFKNGAGGANPDTIITNFREGTVTWTVRQAEDYKYIGDEMTCSVIVGTVPSPGCTIKLYDGDNNERKCSEFGDNRAVWSPAGKAVKLYFEAERTTLLSKSITPYEYVNGEWVTHDGWAVGGSLDRNSFKTFDRDLSANATAVKFSASNDDDVRVRKVYVTGVSYFNIDTIGGGAITKLNMPVNTKGGNVTRAKFCVDYGTCADNIKLASDHPRIKFAASNSTTHSFSTGTNHHGRDTIELTYTSPVDEGEDITATITIYTPYDHETLTVKAISKGKLSTTLEYKGADSYSVDHANMNATDLFQVRDENGDLLASPAITLSSSATGVINTVSSNTAIDFLCGGAATITASYAGDATYAAASNLGQTITVNKLSDAISWSSVGDDGKIHVLADTDIPTSIASANTDIASYSVASANPYLSVTEVEGVYTLHAGNVGEVALTATSEGDCTYAAVSGSKTIAVDPREHAIIWDQNLEGIQTDDRGYITNRRITLNACAVDNGSNPTSVPVSYEITGGGTFATIENGNELVINVANLSGTLSTTITATTTVGTKYAIVSETKTISVVRWGTNTAKSADNTSDIKDGKIVISAPHATFTFSGATAITEFGYATVMGKPEGYKLAQSLDKNGGSMTYNFSWVSTNANCSIQVNKISFWIKAYDSDAFVANKAKVSFDGAKEVSVGTAAMTANDGDFKPFSKAENYTNRNVPVVCWVTGSENFDFYIKNIAIEYTVYTTAPSATGDIEQVDRTINAESDKKTVDVRDLFSYATPAPSDFEYSYEIVGAPEHAFLEGGYMFWADAVGDYTVRAKVNMEEDHRESDWSDEKTIRVNRVPYIFNNSAADKNWETTTNWRIGGWPIENLPTADDDVIVRGQLSVSEEIPVRSLTIDGGVGGVVEIAPTGGLTVGAGGLVGSTSDKLILKASTAGKNGYLRVSPEYAGEMPNATIEYYCTGYYDQTKSGDNAATYQCVGAPITASGVRARDVYPAGTYLYTWNESTGAWTSGRAKLTFSPFQGFETSQRLSSDGWKAEYEGQLVSGRSTWTIDLAYTDGMGYNLLANSFAAPIAIENFEEDDFVNADQLIYILNAGTRGDSKANVGDYDAPGKWVGIPIKTASELAADGYPCMIPCMQGFWIKATGSSAQLKLDYSRLVWGVDYSGVCENKPLRAPKRASGNEDAPVTGRLKVNLFSETENDFVYLLESERYSANYENGYDARKMYSGDVNIFTIAENEELSVDATNSIIGTRVGVHTGAETAYTLEFSHLSGENELALRDNETNEVIDINEGTQYTFFAEPNSVITERFQIVARQSAPSITTGVEKAENDTKVHKFIKDDQLYILKNGILYNALGAIVR